MFNVFTGKVTLKYRLRGVEGGTNPESYVESFLPSPPTTGIDPIAYGGLVNEKIRFANLLSLIKHTDGETAEDPEKGSKIPQTLAHLVII